MASFSSTRNKIQAILSSFMHEKDELSKERSTERDIGENPGLLSMLCQPRNRENFYDRVETFSMWPMKPLFLSPQHCALYGWENTDVDVLTCVSCKATVDGMIGTDWDTDMYNSTCAELRSSIINGHSKFCPWKETPCPESFLSLPARTSQEWKKLFEHACQSLLSLEGNLPVLKREAFQELEISEDVLSILSNYITDSDTSTYHQDIIDTVCVLALCGWNTSSSDKDSPGVLCCSSCHREAGLWNFHSLNTVALIKNDGNQGDEEIDEGPRNNDGHNGSQVIMEEDTEDHDDHTQQVAVDTREVEDTQCNDGVPRDSTSKEEEMLCDVGILRDNDGVSHEHLESNVEVEDNGSTEEHIAMHEDKMVNDDYTTEDTECENRSSGDMLGSEENDGDRSPEYLETICKMDPGSSLSSEVESVSDAQNISEAAESLDPEEYTNIELQHTSLHHENTLENIKDENQTANENVSSELCTCGEISPEKNVDSSSNDKISKEIDVETESKVSEDSCSEEHTPTREKSSADESPLPEQDTHMGQNAQTEQELISEQEPPPEQEHLSEQAPSQEQSHIPEQTSELETEPLPEDKPLQEESTEQEHGILPLPETSSSSEVEETNDNQPPGSITSGCTYESNPSTEPGGCAFEDCAGPGTSGISIEPSRLFGTAVFSPAHSRQDSLIVEIGEESLSERLLSIQSDLLDRGETSSQMDSCRSLSEWSEGEGGEPSSKRLKTDGIEKIEFDVLAEHRNWCPWFTAVPSARNTAENIQKLPGWQILLEHLIQSTSPKIHPVVKHVPPTQVWKSVRRLFHDCHTTIMRTTKSHVVEGKV